MTTDKLEYRVVEIEDKHMTQVLLFGPGRPRGVLVAYWQWKLTGRQGAYVAATRLRNSRQRMVDMGKPVQVEAQLFTGMGAQPAVKVTEEVREQYAMKLEGK